MRQIKLTPRLQTIAGFIEEGASVADIGTDHGYLPVYLAQHRKARRIIASDMSAGSLGAARRSAEKYGVSDKIEFVVAPGLTGIGGTGGHSGTGVPDGTGGHSVTGRTGGTGGTGGTGVNDGTGGHSGNSRTGRTDVTGVTGVTGVTDVTDVDTIVIAGVGGETIIGILEEAPWARKGKKLILQPQTKKDELLRYLNEAGIKVLETALAHDRGREYTVILCSSS